MNWIFLIFKDFEKKLDIHVWSEYMYMYMYVLNITIIYLNILYIL